MAVGLLFIFTNRGNRGSDGSTLKSGYQIKPRSSTKQERQMPAPRTKKEIREKFEVDRKKGISEREIRRILDDAMAVGIVDVGKPYPTLDDFKGLKLRRDRWYLEILDEGLGLSGDQKKSLLASLRAGEDYYSEFMDEFIKMETPDEAAKNPREHQDHVDEMEKIVTTLSMLTMGEIFSPEFSSILTGAQKEILTRHGNFETGYFKGWLQTRDFGTDEKYEWSDTSMFAPRDYMNAGRIFPLGMEQVDRIRAYPEGDLLGKSGVLTAVQFRTLLVCKPELIPEIIRQFLEKPR